MRTISRLVCPRMLCSVYMSPPFSRYRVAKSRVANVLKQWDATLDGRTRPSHARIDGEIRETDEEYSNGLMFPGDPSGPAEEVIFCRCVSKTRARWALDADELQKLQDRAKFFGLDKIKDFDSFKAKYLEAVKNKSSLLYHEGERITKSIEYIVTSKIIQSRTYAEKFDHMASSSHERREYLRAAKEILHHRSRQNGEDLYLYNRLTGKWVKSTAGNEAGTPEYTEAIIDAISKSRPGQLVAFHNHPASMPPSDSDLNAELQNGYSVGYILCHDGKIFEYTQPERPIRSTAYDLIIADFKEKGYHEYDTQIETLRALSAEYGFDFKEVK